MRSVDVGYLAGFWEGEGSCGMRGRRRYNTTQGRWYSPQLRLEITQKFVEPLEYIREVFSPGDTKHIYYDRVNDCYRYILASKDAYRFLYLIRPYVRSPYKQEQIDMALKEYYELVKGKDCNITGHGGSCGV